MTRHQKRFNYTKIGFLIIMVASWWPSVFNYWRIGNTFYIFLSTVLFILNVLMVFAVYRIRRTIKDAPFIQPNERAVLAHVLIFPLFMTTAAL